MHGSREDLNAHGCQASGTGVGGMGDGFSWAEGYMAVACTVLKSLFLLSHHTDSVCPVDRMLVILSVMLMKGKVSLPLDSRHVHVWPLYILTGEMVVC